MACAGGDPVRAVHDWLCGVVTAGTREPNAPDSYCFTSGESNWSNNPLLMSKKWFQEKMRDIAFMDW